MFGVVVRSELLREIRDVDVVFGRRGAVGLRLDLAYAIDESGARDGVVAARAVDVDDRGVIGHWVNEEAFFPQSPDFMWPADHTWCVATDIDDDSTLIGGPPRLIDELCASTRLEVLPIAPDAPYEDHHNR